MVENKCGTSSLCTDVEAPWTQAPHIHTVLGNNDKYNTFIKLPCLAVLFSWVCFYFNWTCMSVFVHILLSVISWENTLGFIITHSFISLSWSVSLSCQASLKISLCNSLLSRWPCAVFLGVHKQNRFALKMQPRLLSSSRHKWNLLWAGKR